jgi:predicted acylesterase/phospholipase RssA
VSAHTRAASGGAFTLGACLLPLTLWGQVRPAAGEQSPSEQSAAAARSNAASSAEPEATSPTEPPANEPSKADTASSLPLLSDQEGLALPARVDALTITVSGAVSLGSYEAGKIFLLSAALHGSPDAPPLVVGTGASAGSANALIALTESCVGPGPLAEDSLGYLVWTNVGLDDLFDEKLAGTGHLFHTEALHRGFSLVADRWQRGLPPECAFVFSAAVTREAALDIHVAEGLVAARQAERITLRIEGQKRGMPALSNYVDPNYSFMRPLLELSDGPMTRSDKAALESVVVASAAFPLAFPSRKIAHCLSDADPEGGLDAPHCPKHTRVDRFVDGGLFDNNPLGTAVRLGSHGFYRSASGELVTRELPTGGPEAPAHMAHVFVSPDLTRYPLRKPPAESKDGELPLISSLARLGGQFFASARAQALAETTELHRGSLSHFWLLRSNAPPISELLGAFFGFFERDFRDFDFHLGTYDTFVELRSKAAASIGVDGFVAALVEEFDGPAQQVPLGHRKLACIAAHLEPKRHGHLAAACSGDELHNFRALLQVSIDRLWSNCRLLDEPATEIEHEQCKQARLGQARPLVDPEFSAAQVRYQGELEGDFDYTLERLGSYHFEYRDLGLGKRESKEARRVIRQRLGDMVTTLAQNQESLAHKALIDMGGRMALNDIAYQPPPQRVYAQIGSSLAVGYLGRLFGSSFYLNPDLRVGRFSSLWNSRAYEFNGTPSLGVEWALLPISGSVVSFGLGVRGGYQISGNDDAGAIPCTAEAANDESRNCSQFVLQTPVNVTFLERVRFSVTPSIFPVGQDFAHNPFDLELGLGVQFY